MGNTDPHGTAIHVSLVQLVTAVQGATGQEQQDDIRHLTTNTQKTGPMGPSP
jgi:hypothetical protein